MSTHPQEQPPHREAREEMHTLLATNPNYFGTLANVDLPAVLPLKFNTTYEQLTCVGLWPERDLLEATFVVKLPFGFLGPMCSPGSHEFIRFFIDWDGDGDFSDAQEDLGLTEVRVHDIPDVQQHHLCYAARLRFKPLLATCENPYIVQLRAILSWELVPTPGDPNFIPPWGNVLDCWVQVDPVAGKLVGVLAEKPKNVPATPEQMAGPPQRERQIPRERAQFLELLQQNPNAFGTEPLSELKPIASLQYDTRFEQLTCIGLYPEADFLEAIIEVKLPYGFLGDLCSPGSHEYVRFFLDWNGDGDFVDFNEDVGVAAVRVHDIPEVDKVHLCYAVGRSFKPLRARCERPRIVRVRAILSWQAVPTGPNFIPPWGNVVDCWVQINPTDGPLDVLTAEITSPAENSCANSAPVPACTTGGAPLIGITIVGTAAGPAFSHYTLRYSWGGGGTVQNAVVYPDCSRPPANPSATVPVISGTLGWLDVTLLPPGVTEFTVDLDVYDSGAGHVAASRTFKIRTQAVEITAAATVNVVEGHDPFHPLAPVAKLIKATNDANIAVPELSIGGAFSVTGSAYVVGCDRILSQFDLRHFQAPPAAPIPTPMSVAGGTPMIPTPVLYDGTSAHPWQSGCFPVITPNIILNGDLVAQWSVNTCVFLGTSYTVPKVKPLPFFQSGACGIPTSLNGRYVVLLEAQDVPVGMPGPSAIAAVDRVAVWIDNRCPVAEIHSIGGLEPCADLHLKDYVGTTAEVRGVAWDPPIDASAPQHAPNDNFGSYAMSFQKNGGVSVPLAGATPTMRVPNIWPTLPVGAEGTLANWDIVNALDAASPTPTPAVPASAKLARGERCAYVVALSVSDQTHVGDSGNHNTAGPVLYAITIINDIS